MSMYSKFTIRHEHSKDIVTFTEKHYINLACSAFFEIGCYDMFTGCYDTRNRFYNGFYSTCYDSSLML